jgi:hypothetical protein
MLIKKLVSLSLASVFTVSGAAFTAAQSAGQTPATAQPTPDPVKQQEEKAKLEGKATALLEQVISEAQGLKLLENRIRVQIAGGDLLWDRNPTRARGLFMDAGAALGQMTLDTERPERDDLQAQNRLRSELVLTAGRHDAELGYQLLRSTQPQTLPINMVNGRRVGPDPQSVQNNLEQSLLATIAATDPKMAYQKAAESLDKGEFPTSLSRVLAQLQAKDAENFKKLSDKTLSKLGSDSILASREATALTVGLLRPGPRPESTSTSSTAGTAPATGPVSNQVLSEAAFRDLMESAITAALSTTSIATNNRGGGGAGRGPGVQIRGAQPNQQQNPPDEAQVRQNNARTLLFSMQAMLPQIDQYLPDRAAAVRQKFTDLGMTNNSQANFGNQMRSAMQQGSSESMVAAASTAPPQIQSRLYQSAALKAVDEGNTDRAVQIANEHLDENQRAPVMQAVDFKRLATTAAPEKLAEIKDKLAGLRNDSERANFLVTLAVATTKDNPKLALRFLDDARPLVMKKAANYRDLEDQMKVAAAYASLDSRRSFELLEVGISQLNELLSAAQVLNGFEVDIFRDGELSLRGDNELVGMVSRYGRELASLAKVDFERARITAERFQLPEPRMNARLSIIQNVLGAQGVDNPRRNQNNFQFLMR